MNFYRHMANTYLSKSFLFITIALCASTSFADPKYSGYLRSGLGVSESGSDQQCFKAVGSLAKFRLGNECENYLELGITHTTPAKKPGQYSFLTNLRFAVQSQGHRDFESTSPDVAFDEDQQTVSGQADTVIAFREAYVSASRNFKTESILWIGKRFYQRRDIHMLDYFLTANTGTGAGWEQIPVGVGRLHFAWIRNNPKNEGPTQHNIDLRYEGLRLPLLGRMTAKLVHAQNSNRDAYNGQKNWSELSGQQAQLFFDRALANGFTMLSISYGHSLFGGIGSWRSSGLDQYGAWGSQNIASTSKQAKKFREKSSATRVAGQWVNKWRKEISSSFVAVYQTVDFGGYKSGSENDPDLNEIALGIRPIWHFGEQTDLMFEYGINQVENAFLDSNEGKFKDSILHKITIAPSITLENSYFSRPQLRLFLTQSTWNDDSKGRVASEIYATKNSGWSAGAQIEAWW